MSVHIELLLLVIQFYVKTLYKISQNSPMMTHTRLPQDNFKTQVLTHVGIQH